MSILLPRLCYVAAPQAADHRFGLTLSANIARADAIARIACRMGFAPVRLHAQILVAETSSQRAADAQGRLAVVAAVARTNGTFWRLLLPSGDEAGPARDERLQFERSYLGKPRHLRSGTWADWRSAIEAAGLGEVWDALAVDADRATNATAGAR